MKSRAHARFSTVPIPCDDDIRCSFVAVAASSGPNWLGVSANNSGLTSLCVLSSFRESFQDILPRTKFAEAALSSDDTLLFLIRDAPMKRVIRLQGSATQKSLTHRTLSGTATGLHHRDAVRARRRFTNWTDIRIQTTTLLWPTHVLGGCGPERSGTRRTALDH